MDTLKIGGKEYKIEFSFEAAEYKNCIDKFLKLMTTGYFSGDDAPEKPNKTDIVNAIIKETTEIVTSLPSVVTSCLYAGLLENNPVENEAAAKELFKQFVKENPGDERSNYMGMLVFLGQQMETDGFLELTGLDQVIENLRQATAEVKKEVGNQASRKPASRKKSASTK